MQNQETLQTGTTTVAVVCKDGIVLAADKRATAGYLIAQSDVQKIEKLTDDIAVTMAGTVSDAQLVIRLMQSELKLKKIRTEQPTDVVEAANLMARIVYGNIRKFSVIPGISHFLLAGKDSSGFHLYDIFPDGALSECKEFVSSGSGSVFAYGVLESQYTKNLSVVEGIKLVGKAVNAALKRDIASGDGIDIFTITSDGAKKVLTKEMNRDLPLN